MAQRNICRMSKKGLLNGSGRALSMIAWKPFTPGMGPKLLQRILKVFLQQKACPCFSCQNSTHHPVIDAILEGCAAVLPSTHAFIRPQAKLYVVQLLPLIPLQLIYRRRQGSTYLESHATVMASRSDATVDLEGRNATTEGTMICHSSCSARTAAKPKVPGSQLVSMTLSTTYKIWSLQVLCLTGVSSCASMYFLKIKKKMEFSLITSISRLIYF